MAVTRDDAQHVAERLKAASARIFHIELFGSVLRNGSGHDADLVFIVDEPVARDWWREAGDELRVRMGTRWLPLRRFIKTFLPWLDEVSIRSRKSRRLKLLSKYVRVDVESVVHQYKKRMVVDAFLFPENWREESEPNTKVLCALADVIRDHTETRLFVERIARSAERLV